MIKFKFWDSIGNRFCDDSYLFVDANGLTYKDTEEEMISVPHAIATQSIGLTDNNGSDIYYGDVYHVAGYGTLAIESIHDVVTLLEAKAEGDLGDKLGDIYSNPELKEAE